MAQESAHPNRCVVLAGTATSGKTSLLQALLHTAGAIDPPNSGAGGHTVGDHSPEARRREMSTEPNIAHAEFLGESWSLIDCPGSIELMQDTKTCLMGADVAVVVVDPDPAKALTLTPLLRFLDAHRIPHMLFVNKVDAPQGPIKELIAALQDVSSRPLVLRQVPLRDGDRVTGYVDLVSERAYRYRTGQSSELIRMPESVQDDENAARQELLESLADFDDALLEKLLEDVVPPAEEIYQDITQDLANDKIVPVMLGAAQRDHGVTRLWKALRHETPDPSVAAARLNVPEAAGAQAGDLAACVLRTFYLPHTGKLSLIRLWQGELREDTNLAGQRLGSLYRMFGSELIKQARAEAGDLIALGRIEDLHTGDVIGPKGRVVSPEIAWPEPGFPVYGLVVHPQRREDEVKLTSALGKLREEDASLILDRTTEDQGLLLRGQGELHLGIALERLGNRFNVAVDSTRPHTSYRETIRKGTRYHARFKRQSGGHGQFADIQVEISPQPRSAGFNFTSSIVGGAVPKQYIPAVEAGVREGLQRGPLGFEVVDVAVELLDGQYHSVDSSDEAFRTAGRIAMQEGLQDCDSVLLEPIDEVRLAAPRAYISRVTNLVSGKRGQILGIEEKADWPGWDEVRAHMPASELGDLIVELRSVTQGVGFFEHAYDHLQELSGRLADKVVHERQSTAR
ncbi:elongation factor G [Rhodovibrio salinarum]|uniref:Elongation factor G n=1 Tax=Rhodovibrio salinarum TaxID=1087 RepID=A0A934QK86_9PROT|nr:elongation factor G [Rhodovibrio salinarum]MBK1697995.1 elongation factor G [Rhodovibrio salinarum]